jgi:hypothetical protein
LGRRRQRRDMPCLKPLLTARAGRVDKSEPQILLPGVVSLPDEKLSGDFRWNYREWLHEKI